MNQLLQNLVAAGRNNHISLPIALAIGLEIVPVFKPEWQTQCSNIEKILLAYGVIAAANSGPPADVPKEPTPPKP